MGRIRNIFINSGVEGFRQTSIFENDTELEIENIQNAQLKSKTIKHEIVAEDGSFVANNLKYDETKMEKYLLNLKHPEGSSKAKFLKDVLGYNNGDGKELYDKIRKALIGTYPERVTKTISGVKQEYNIKLESKNGQFITAKVVVIVQKDNGKTFYRIITMYPGKKEK